MKKFYLSRCTTSVLFFIFLCNVLLAQTGRDRLSRMNDRLQKDQRVKTFELDRQKKTPTMVVVDDDAQITDKSEKESLNAWLDLRPGFDELRLVSTTATTSGITVNKYQQYFKGIKVEHGKYMASSRSGKLLSVNGSFYDVPVALSTRPSLSENQALQKAIAYVKPKKMAYEQVEEMIRKQPQHEKVLREEKESYMPRGELVIIRNFLNGSEALHLAYKFDIYAAEPLYRAKVFVDARDGRILLQDMIIKHADGQAKTRYAGTRTIKTKQVTVPVTGGTDPANGITPYVWTGNSARPPISNRTFYVLHDETRGMGILTFDLNGVGGAPISVPALYNQATSFTDPDNAWNDGSAATFNDHLRSTPSGGAAEAENDDFAFDAHWGAEMVYDYWKNIHGRLSFDNLNAAIKSFVHYGVAYDNAFWNGSVMTYGDGSGSNPLLSGFKPLTSLDVCGHEIGHGICTYTSDLVYEKESGAMNEGFSDIWAACVENYVLKNVDPTLPYKVWSIGEQIDTRAGRALRRMDNPNAEGNPDTYGGAFWSNPDCSPDLINDYCGVHNNSGVLNHWFYQLVAGDGLSHVNDIGQAYKVLGVGFAKAEQIAYLTELRLSPTATFSEARNVSILAAVELFGQCSPEHKATVNAWHAVGVGTGFAANCLASVSFTESSSSVSEETGSVACGTIKYHSVTVSRPISNGQPLTLALIFSGTAVRNYDYTLSATSVSWLANETGNKQVVITIRGDQLKDPNETIIISFNPPAGHAVTLRQHTVTIVDDDIDPRIGTSRISLLTQNFEQGTLPAGWQSNLGPISNTVNKWIVGNAAAYGTGNYAAFISSAGGVATYDFNTVSDVVLRTSLVDGRGLSDIRVQFNYVVGGERDVPTDINPDTNGDGQITAAELEAVANSGPALDYGRLVYSTDGIKFFDLGNPLALSPTKKLYTVSLPASLNNKTFYLGFRWVSDPLVSFMPTPSFVVDDLQVTAQPTQIQSAINKIGEAAVPVNATAYVYSISDQKLLTKVVNTGTIIIGCQRVNLIQGGTRKIPILNGHRTEKAFYIYSTLANAAYQVSFYFTNQELAVWGADVSKLKVMRTTAVDLSTVSTANSSVLTPVISNNGGKYYTFTVPVTGSAKYFLYVPMRTPVGSSLNEGSVSETDGKSSIMLYPNPAASTLRVQFNEATQSTVQLEITDATGRTIKSRTIRRGESSGYDFDVSKLATGVYMMRITYSEKLTVKQFRVVR